MCGIWAYFGPRDQNDRLVDISHRGPDDRGRELFQCGDRELELAMWRLSILDLSPQGHQPMTDTRGRLHLIFNGEIYNYRELRDELEKLGHVFHSSGDTEVLLAAYERWGPDCLSRCFGMFALCLWDREKETLFVARDRFGIKPLYYFISGREIAFASEIKQFAGLKDFRARINLKRATEFLVFAAQDHSSETMFDGVHQLRGGQSALLSTRQWEPGDGLEVRNWYELKTPPRFEGTFEQATKGYHDLFLDSVRLHLRSDVPVGSCLSGGMDSSAIVCGTHHILKQTGDAEIQNTFSCCFDDPKCDERPFMHAVENFTGVDAHYIFPRCEDMLQLLERGVWYQDEPFSGTSIFAQYYVFEAARAAGVKVMLDGQGGDEQLASYPQFFGLHLLGLLSTLRLGQAAYEMRRFRQLHNWGLSDTVKSLLFWFAPSPLDTVLRKNRLLKQRHWLRIDNLAKRGVHLDSPWRRNGASDFGSTAWLSRMMLTTTTLPMLLHWEDRNSMAHSIEARVPFLDHRLVEFTLSLPNEFKTKAGVTKRILKSAMAALMPEQVINRTDKMGFATPEEVWFRRDQNFRNLVIASARDYPMLFSEEGVKREINLVLEQQKAFSGVFWRIIALSVWMKRFNVEF